MNLGPEGSQQLQDWELMSAGGQSHFALSLPNRSQAALGPCRLFAPKWEEVGTIESQTGWGRKGP